MCEYREIDYNIMICTAAISITILLYYSKVARHLAKLFDSMSSLMFTDSGSEQVTDEAVGMYSKDGEYVEFNAPCQCVGQVSFIIERVITPV